MQSLSNEKSRLSRNTALELYTRGSAWFSNEQNKKGEIKVGMLADMAVLDQDYFAVEDEEIKNIESILTIVGGNIVYAKGDFSSYSPPTIPILPDWSPTSIYNGYHSKRSEQKVKGDTQNTPGSSAGLIAQVHSCVGSCNVHGHSHESARLSNIPVNNYTAFWGVLGCSCFAF